MPRLKFRLAIDLDIDFCVGASLETTDWEATAVLRRKKRAYQGRPKLAEGAVIDLPSDDFEEQSSEESSASEE